jgi:hypothetical protein
MKKIILALMGIAIFISCGGKRGSNVTTDTATVSEQQAGELPAGELPAASPIESTPADIVLEKVFLYDQHTLADSYPYKDDIREFQFDKMRTRLFMLDSIQQGRTSVWAILQNRKNWKGQAPNVKDWTTDEYHTVADRYGVERTQSVPLYIRGELGFEAPERYGRDGSVVKLLGFNADSTAYVIESFNAPGIWEAPVKYVKPIDTQMFKKAVMVDRTNQNIATVEKMDDKWLIRSMNPCTTGEHAPPHAYPTPVGMFVIQDREPKMLYNNGGPVIVGFAPWASRFTNGAFLHGVPVNNPNGQAVEFSTTLGTIPRSHECVRNATSHAKFIYDWAPVNETIVFVYD